MIIQRISQLIAGTAIISMCLGCTAEEDASPALNADERVAASKDDIPRAEPSLEHCGDPLILAEQLTALINEFRSEPRDCGTGILPAVSPLSWDMRLENAAIVHSDDMAATNFFNHIGSDGSTPGDRMDRQGYVWIDVVENLGPDHDLVSEVVEFWKNSSKGHCDNLMSSEVDDLGAACIYSENSDRQFSWVLKMGKD